MALQIPTPPLLAAAASHTTLAASATQVSRRLATETLAATMRGS